MAESVLVNRKKFISSLDNKLVEPLNALSKKTRVPKSRLLDEAIEDLLKKYEKKDGSGEIDPELPPCRFIYFL